MGKKYFEIQGISDVFNSDFDFSSETFFVAYLFHKLLIGEVKDKKFITYKNETVDSKFLKEMRIFNEKNELLLLRKDNSLQGRLWQDNNDSEFIETTQVLWGTHSQPSDDPNFSLISEDRGIMFYAPAKIVQGKNLDTAKTRLKIITHSEIGYTDLAQATIVDYRYVKFVI